MQTHIVAPCSRWPDWYIRWHRFTNTGSGTVNIQAVQGGFAIQGRGDKYGEVLPTHAHSSEFSIQASRNNASFPQGTVTTQNSALICSNAGASGIAALNPNSTDHSTTKMYAEVLKPDANTNLMWQRTLIPTIRDELCIPPSTTGQPPSEFGSAVFALARTSDREERYAGLSYSELWGDVPVLDTGTGEEREGEWYIKLE